MHVAALNNVTSLRDWEESRGGGFVCLFGTIAVHRITEYERDDDRREMEQYKNYLQYTKETHILVIRGLKL